MVLLDRVSGMGGEKVGSSSCCFNAAVTPGVARVGLTSLGWSRRRERERKTLGFLVLVARGRWSVK